MALVGTPATARLIAERYALGTGSARLRPVARGAMGQVWLLRIGGDHQRHQWAIKELFWAPDPGEPTAAAEAAVAYEVSFRDAAAAAGVAAPASVRTAEGTYLWRVPVQDATIRVQTWVAGAAADPASRRGAVWIGQTLARMHRLGWAARSAPHPRPDPWYDTAPPPQRWEQHVEAAHAAGTDWAGRLGTVRRRLVALSGRVTPADPDTLIVNHRDEQPANVLVDGSGRHTLIDWDNVGVDAADRVLACALWSWRGDRGQRRRILAAYAAAGGPAQLREDSFTTVYATYLNYLDTQARLALDIGQPPPQRTYAAAEVRRLLTRIPDGVGETGATAVT